MLPLRETVKKEKHCQTQGEHNKTEKTDWMPQQPTGFFYLHSTAVL